MHHGAWRAQVLAPRIYLQLMTWSNHSLRFWEGLAFQRPKVAVLLPDLMAFPRRPLVSAYGLFRDSLCRCTSATISRATPGPFGFLRAKPSQNYRLCLLYAMPIPLLMIFLAPTLTLSRHHDSSTGPLLGLWAEFWG